MQPAIQLPISWRRRRRRCNVVVVVVVFFGVRLAHFNMPNLWLIMIFRCCKKSKQLLKNIIIKLQIRNAKLKRKKKMEFTAAHRREEKSAHLHINTSKISLDITIFFFLKQKSLLPKLLSAHIQWICNRFSRKSEEKNRVCWNHFPAWSLNECKIWHLRKIPQTKKRSNWIWILRRTFERTEAPLFFPFSTTLLTISNWSV